MTPQTYKLLTDALVVFHFAFVAFVVLGGLAALRWNRIGWLHIPCVLWVIWIETSGNLCPLTPLENDLRDKAGLATYEGGFVDHYIMPVLYPEHLTRNTQFAIAIGLVAINAISYGLILMMVWRRRHRLQPKDAALASTSPTPTGTTPDNPLTAEALPEGR
ncbi:DUF2784 domain-containing protein [Humisphaera borealis]|uniref:DUF2784 domain-containing protein n=1 Tax=Humisphaera borealis TaxID=2807512 RepID=A0A7M2WPX0_9BACT|nr:DUF2784 domain-containing protein [Humisphaera borealis]QOV87518.1 DUF2784 domain-containing protein [Humisphaera borealis]